MPTENDPIPDISEITHKGLVTISWSKPMIDILNITEYEEDMRTIIKTEEVKTGRRVERPAFEIYNAYSISHSRDNDLL